MEICIDTVLRLTPAGPCGNLPSGAESCGIPHLHAPPRHRRYSRCLLVLIVSYPCLSMSASTLGNLDERVQQNPLSAVPMATASRWFRRHRPI